MRIHYIKYTRFWGQDFSNFKHTCHIYTESMTSQRNINSLIIAKWTSKLFMDLCDIPLQNSSRHMSFCASHLEVFNIFYTLMKFILKMWKVHHLDVLLLLSFWFCFFMYFNICFNFSLCGIEKNRFVFKVQALLDKTTSLKEYLYLLWSNNNNGLN